MLPSLLLASIHAATPLFAPAPPADSFSASVDLAATKALGAKKSCHARDGLDLSGDAAYVWGSTFHVASAATCCEACAAHRAICGNGSGGKVYWDDGKHRLRCRGNRGRCNAWVFCAAEAGQCFSYDIHVHKRGECWLKHEPNISVPVAAGASTENMPAFPSQCQRLARSTRSHSHRTYTAQNDGGCSARSVAMARFPDSMARGETTRANIMAVGNRCAEKRSCMDGIAGAWLAGGVLQEARTLLTRDET